MSFDLSNSMLLVVNTKKQDCNSVLKTFCGDSLDSLLILLPTK